MVNNIGRFAKIIFKMSRPPVAMILLLFAFIGTTQSGHILGFSWQLLFVGVVVVSFLINASSLNDLADEEIDKINLAGSAARPLANKRATRREIGAVALLSALTMLILSWLYGHNLLVVSALGICFNWAYSFRPLRISYRGFAATASLPVAYVVIPFIVGLLASGNNWNQQRLFLLAGMYVCFMGRIILKDFRDVQGDSQFGKRTFLLRHGRSVTCLTSLGLWLLGSILLVLTNPLLLIALSIYLPFIFAGLYFLSRSSSFSDEQWIIWSIARIGTAVAITILVFSQLNGQSWSRQLLWAAGIAVPFVGLYWQVLGSRIMSAKPGRPKFIYRSFELAPKSPTGLPRENSW